MLRCSPELADVLSDHRSAIVPSLAGILRDRVGGHYRERTPRELGRWAGQALDAVIESLRSGSYEPLAAYAAVASRTRGRLGFEIAEVIEGLLSLEQAALPFILRGSVAGPDDVAQMIGDLNACLRSMVARFSELFAEGMRQSVERSLAESVARQRITSAVLDSAGHLEEVLELVCREAKDLLGSRGVAILLLEEEGRLRLARGVGDGSDVAESLLRALNPGAVPVPIEPLKVNDLSASGIEVAAAGSIASLLAVPLKAHGEIIGALQALNKPRGFDRDDVRLARLIAERAAIAIEHTRLHERQEEIAVLEERQRLARDLHDSVSQSIYGVTTFAEAAVRRLDTGDISGAADHLRELRDTALEALREMRLLLFELRPPDIAEQGLVVMLRARLTAVEGRAGLHTKLEAGDVERLPLTIEEGLYRVAQEALNNSLKHARASRIVARISRSASGVTLELSDDGVGFDLKAGRSKAGLGLRGMEERVARMNGTLSIETRPGHGTRVRVAVPCPVQ